MTETLPTTRTPAAPPAQRVDMMPLFERALEVAEKGGNVAQAVETFYKLHVQEQERQNRAAFAAALRKFQAECPPIPKPKQAKIPKKSGGVYKYRYNDYEGVLRHCRQYLEANGFSHRFDAEVSGAMLTCVCTLTHEAGHSEDASFTLPTESSNPGMSPQQKYASALSFAKKQTLVSVLGIPLTEADPEDEGPAELVDEETVANIEAKIVEVGANRARVLEWVGVGSPAEIKKRDAARLFEQLEAFRKRKETGR